MHPNYGTQATKNIGEGFNGLGAGRLLGAECLKSTEPQAVSEIPGALSRLHVSTARVNELIRALIDRIGPVLSQSSEKMGPGRPTTSHSTPLALTIDETSSLLEVTGDLIEDVLRRVQV